ENLHLLVYQIAPFGILHRPVGVNFALFNQLVAGGNVGLLGGHPTALLAPSGGDAFALAPVLAILGFLKPRLPPGFNRAIPAFKGRPVGFGDADNIARIALIYRIQIAILAYLRDVLVLVQALLELLFAHRHVTGAVLGALLLSVSALLTGGLALQSKFIGELALRLGRLSLVHPVATLFGRRPSVHPRQP